MIATLVESKLKTLLENLSRHLEVIAPVLVDGVPVFSSWNGEPLALDTNTSTPPTEFLFPNRDVLFKYIQESGRYTFEEVPAKQRVIFGLRPCDLSAIRVLDAIFRSHPQDHPYQEKRKSTIILAINCTQPDKDCFCASLGTGPSATDGYDLLFTRISSGYLVESGSPAGILIMKENSDLFEEAKQEHIREAELLMKNIKASIRSDRTMERIREAIDNADWNRLGEKCLRCLGCTFVCPVCHCFNIIDLGIPDGERLRCRDSCILSGFTRMSGSNPRKTQGDRLQNWYRDKFFYIPENTGLVGCVGCGRCSKVCLSGGNRWTLEA